MPTTITATPDIERLILLIGVILFGLHSQRAFGRHPLRAVRYAIMFLTAQQDHGHDMLMPEWNKLSATDYPLIIPPWVEVCLRRSLEDKRGLLLVS